MQSSSDIYDLAIIGAGIVGLATAHFLHQSAPDRKIVVIDKESGPGLHQTGHNSGVIHAGIYYAPGSLKAKLCTAGAKATKDFCDTHKIAYENCGKLIVATDASELSALDELERRATQNGQVVQPVSREELAEREPMVLGVQALFSPASGIVDYGEICRVLHRRLESSGVDFLFGQAVTGLEERTDNTVVTTSGGALSTRLVVACAGLQADRIAALSGVADDFRIIPFRGEYYRVADRSKVQVNHLIYPVPDPSLPFLGVHLTKMIGGYSTVGPNAMYSLGRETYAGNRPDWADLGRSLAFPGFWKLMARSLRPGLHELSGSLLKSVYLKRCQKYCPDLRLEDLEPYEPGIRAQAVGADEAPGPPRRSGRGRALPGQHAILLCHRLGNPDQRRSAHLTLYQQGNPMNEMQILPNSPEARDIAYHFHGYTNAAAHAETGPMIIERGEGIYVYDSNGNRYIEALSGLWSAAVGFNEPRLAKAAADQMAKLPFYHNFGHKSHGPAIDLAEKLISLAPVPMSKVFFTNSGSEANDTVLKMLWYRSNALGQPERKKVIARQRGYHGVTIAAGSLTGLPNNHRSFDLPIDRVLHTTCPHYWKDGKGGETEEEFATRCATDLESLIEAEGPETIAAFFAEPVMGAGGVVVPPRTYWDKIQAVLDKYDILLVADEVICGFGRTGQMFGSHTFGMKPDVMVMSKQITSSYVPFSAFMMNDRFYAPIAEESGRIGVLGHGFTGGSHPLGAAVALENIAIIEERELVANARTVGARFHKKLDSLQDHPLVGEIRGVGFISALELVNDKAAKSVTGPVGALGGLLNAALLRNGAITRNLGDAVAFCPPLITSEEQVDDLFAIVKKSLDDVTRLVKEN